MYEMYFNIQIFKLTFICDTYSQITVNIVVTQCFDLMSTTLFFSMEFENLV